MLEEEMIDLITFCLQSTDSTQIEEKKNRLTQIGHELYDDGGVDAMENFFFVVENRIKEEIGNDPKQFRSLWNEIDDAWNY